MGPGKKINSVIIDFWNWFSINCQDFGSHFDNAPLLNELDIWVSKLGNYSWEVGPGKIEDNALVISPNGNLKLLKETEMIVENAKKCNGWEYYYAKPPKDWNLIFDFKTINEDQIRVNASTWKYVLLKYNDGFEIVIESPQLTLLNDEDKLAISEIALDGILGEEMRMLTIVKIDVVDELDHFYKRNAGHMVELDNHLKSLIS